MHSALVIVGPVKMDWPEELRKWQTCAAQLPQGKSIEQLGERVWLVTLADGASALAGIVQRTTEFGYPHRILFFEKPPAWVSSPPP